MSEDIKQAAGEFTEALRDAAPRVLTQDGGKSSNVHWARYFPDAEILHIDFKNSKGEKTSTYAYSGFKWEDWRAFCEAESKGRHFAFAIRPMFKGVRQ